MAQHVDACMPAISEKSERRIGIPRNACNRPREVRQGRTLRGLGRAPARRHVRVTGLFYMQWPLFRLFNVAEQLNGRPAPICAVYKGQR